MDEHESGDMDPVHCDSFGLNISSNHISSAINHHDLPSPELPSSINSASSSMKPFNAASGVAYGLTPGGSMAVHRERAFVMDAGLKSAECAH